MKEIKTSSGAMGAEAPPAAELTAEDVGGGAAKRGSTLCAKGARSGDWSEALALWTQGRLPLEDQLALLRAARTDPRLRERIELYRPVRAPDVRRLLPAAAFVLPAERRWSVGGLAGLAAAAIGLVAGLTLGRPSTPRFALEAPTAVLEPDAPAVIEVRGSLAPEVMQAFVSTQRGYERLPWKAHAVPGGLRIEARAGGLTGFRYGETELAIVAGPASCAESHPAHPGEGCFASTATLRVRPPRMRIEPTMIGILESPSSVADPDSEEVVLPEGRHIHIRIEPDIQVAGELLHHLYRWEGAGWRLILSGPAVSFSRERGQFIPTEDILPSGAASARFALVSGPPTTTPPLPSRAPDALHRTTFFTLRREGAEIQP